MGSPSGLTHSQRGEAAGCSRGLSQWASTGSDCPLTARLHPRPATAAVPGLGCWVSPQIWQPQRDRTASTGVTGGRRKWATGDCHCACCGRNSHGMDGWMDAARAMPCHVAFIRFGLFSPINYQVWLGCPDPCDIQGARDGGCRILRSDMQYRISRHSEKRQNSLSQNWRKIETADGDESRRHCSPHSHASRITAAVLPQSTPLHLLSNPRGSHENVGSIGH